jgi:thiosulfate reductase cytochrome b subunit
MSKPPTHPIVLRCTHWIGAAAMITMILSGWAIYNASPLLPFIIPPGLTLGGWLGAGIAWHISAMWVLMADGLVYLAWGFASGHFSDAFLPITAGAVLHDLRDALALRLKHDLDHYNAVQRLLYVLVVTAGVLLVLTGLSIWKPVQLGGLTWCFGGYDIARRIHFILMCCVVAFLVIHVTLVALVPKTLRAMLLGSARP